MLKIKLKDVNILNTIPFIMVVMMPYLPCNGIDVSFFGVNLYQYLHMLNYFLVILIFLGKKYRPSTAVILGSIFYGWMLVATLLNHADTSGLLSRIIQCITFLIIVDYYLAYSKKNFIQAVISLMIIIMLINVFFQVITSSGTFSYGQDGGINNVNFFMSDNFAGYYIVAILCLCFVYMIEYKSIMFEIVCRLLIILLMISTVLSWSGTGLAGTVLFLVICVIVIRNNEKAILRMERIYNGKSVFIICIVFFFTFIVFRLQHLFAIIIEGILHKSLNFTGRTILWDYAFEKIASSPIIGIGSSASGRTFVGYIGHYEHTAHNMILEIILQGGIIALILFLGWMLSAIRITQIQKGNKQSLCIITAILSEFIMYMFEGVIYHQFPFIIFVLAYHIQQGKKDPVVWK